MTILMVTQHYLPDETSTALYMTGIAEEIATEHRVLVLSGIRGSASSAEANPEVVELPNVIPAKRALVARNLAMVLFGLRSFWAVLKRAKAGDVVITVTTPYLLPYFVVLAARLRGASTALIHYDIYPEAIVVAGICTEKSLVVRFLYWLNGHLYGALQYSVAIGRDMEKHLLRYYGMSNDKVAYIPNWATITPSVRPLKPDNAFRQSTGVKFIVGMFGNMGFTHDPVTVFDAARELVDTPGIHFLLSGWGVGWECLKKIQAAANLANVTLVERIPESMLEDFLAAANIWVVPYKKNIAGVSVPSRLYNLLAVGRPVIVLSESDAEQSLIVNDYEVGWVVPPENVMVLVDTIRQAAANAELTAEKGHRAAAVATERFTREASGRSYRTLIRKLQQKPLYTRIVE